MLYLTLFAGVCAMTKPFAAQAEERLTLIVNRDDNNVSYFLSMPADEIAPLLGTDPTILFSNDGAVPIDEFRYSGSFEQGDELFARVSGKLMQTGEKLDIETMSMMVHPTNQPQPFQSPWDAITATSVCNVDYAPDELLPGVLQLYYGGFASDVPTDATISLSFPATGRDDFKVDLLYYYDGYYQGKHTAVLTDGGALELAVKSDPLLGILKALAAFFALISIAAIFLHLRRKPVLVQG